MLRGKFKKTEQFAAEEEGKESAAVSDKVAAESGAAASGGSAAEESITVSGGNKAETKNRTVFSEDAAEASMTTSGGNAAKESMAASDGSAAKESVAGSGRAAAKEADPQRGSGKRGKWFRPSVPEGLFRKCDGCRKILYEEDIRKNWYCCPECGKHFRIDPATRIRLTADAGSFEEWDASLTGDDPLAFPGYQEKLETMRESTGLSEAVVTGRAAIRGCATALGVMSPDFIMGSMGTAVGEKITRMIERATGERLPVVLFCCSGGARMQEGIFSLMQMERVAQALKRHDRAGLLYVPVLTDPTMGGVTASFAMLGDVILAEPGALIGFAGARVIRQTIGQKLPDGFQSAEFLQKHGFVDRIVKREQMRTDLGVILQSCR